MAITILFSKCHVKNTTRRDLPKVPHSLQIFSHLHLLASLKLPHLPKKLVFPLKSMWPHLNTLEARTNFGSAIKSQFLIIRYVVLLEHFFP